MKKLAQDLLKKGEKKKQNFQSKINILQVTKCIFVLMPKWAHGTSYSCCFKILHVADWNYSEKLAH